MTNRFVFSLLAFAVAGTAWAIPAKPSVDAVNKAIARVLAPLQNSTTRASYTFSKIDLAAARTLAFASNGFFSKTGPKGQLGLIVSDLSYETQGKPAPETALQGKLAGDLRLLFPQAELNEFALDLESTFYAYAGEIIERYGAGAAVSFVVKNKVVDLNGDVQSLEGELDIKFDFTKTPASVKIEDEIAQGVYVKFGVKVAEGITLDARMISNPKYRGFQKGEAGLNEYLTKLLTQDPEVLGQISGVMAWLDRVATDILK